jgi:hypothetical protein
MNKNKSKLLSKPADADLIRQVAIRLPQSEYLLLRKNAAKAGMSYSAFIQRLNQGDKVVARLNEEDKALFRELVTMSNDLHQLWKLASEEGIGHALSSFEAGRNVVDALLNKLKL